MSEEDARMLAAQIIEVGSDAFGGGHGRLLGSDDFLKDRLVFQATTR